MSVPFFIASRYLFSKKSHSVINIISLVSSIGMALGTAALVVIMSVYNGFEDIVKDMMSSYESDLMITPSKGKKFVPEGPVYDWLYDNPAISAYTYTVLENVFLSYEGNQSIVWAKGVDSIYAEEFPVDEHIIRGTFYLYHGQIPYASVGVGVAAKMGINPRFLSPMVLYYPDAESNISLTNPAASLHSVKCYPSSVFAINSSIDENTIIVPVEILQEVLGYSPSEFSAVEIKVVEGTSEREIASLKKKLEDMLGDEFEVLSRTQQNPTLYKMLRYEKAAIYLILIFVVIIVAFNIFGSLSMLIIDKKNDIATLSSLGMKGRDIRSVFTLEGWLVSLLGLVTGLIFGLGLALLQQKFGLIKMPGNFAVDAFPVVLKAGDILLATAIIAAIGYIISLIASGKVRTSTR
ncbi:MAG: ABC transporter permease [Bacteroidales bacterium]|nr:ABC transporter permease [Bacteroidales bacterium]